MISNGLCPEPSENCLRPESNRSRGTSGKETSKLLALSLYNSESRDDDLPSTPLRGGDALPPPPENIFEDGGGINLEAFCSSRGTRGMRPLRQERARRNSLDSFSPEKPLPAPLEAGQGGARSVSSFLEELLDRFGQAGDDPKEGGREGGGESESLSSFGSPHPRGE